MQTLASVSEILDSYDAFLCDLWGVIHDGEFLYPCVLETLEKLQDAGKKIIFLSNAPRLAESVLVKMDKMGVRRDCYAGALTSGEAARHYLMHHHKWAVKDNQFLLGSYYYQGLSSDEAMLDGLPQRRVFDLSEADFILNGNFDYHGQPMDEMMPKLQYASQKHLPMLCINPDLEVVKQDGTQIFCAGSLAAAYEKLGGKVGYIGKPYPLVYETALEMLGNMPKNRVLAIGDNIYTDIKGGQAAGVATVLVTQGVLQDVIKTGQTIEAYCREAGILPDYILPSFI